MTITSLLVQLKVTVEYKKDNGRMIPLRVHTIVISLQHSPAVSTKQMEADLNTKVIQVRVLILSPPIYELFVYTQLTLTKLLF